MPPTLQQTKNGTPRLSEQAKHLSVPADITSTGWPAVRKTCIDKLGAEFDPWQDGAGRVILSKRLDGNLAVMIDGVGMSLPRQVGKTHLIGYMVFALCVNNPGLLVIWTAHHSATSSETFLAMQGMAQRAKVAPHIAQVFKGSGDEEVRFVNGSRILFGARERGFGRGIPGVDVLIFDEAQILSDKAMSNMLATMNTSQFGLQLYIGTPPKPEDNSETFKRMRREALAGTLVDGAWIEFGADPDADSESRQQWRKANPSFPKRTPVQSMQRLKRKLTPSDWRREGLGIWDDDQEGSRAISAETWRALEGEPAADGFPSYAVAFSKDGMRMSVGGGFKSPSSGVVHIELIDDPYVGAVEGGLSPLVKWFTERNEAATPRWRRAGAIVLSGSAGAGVLKQMLVQAGVNEKRVIVANTSQYLQACEMTRNAAEERSLTHKPDGQVALDDSVAVCDRDKRGGWRATVPGGDETPIEAVSLALWGAKTTRRKPKGDREERKAKIL
ncbi:terminase large subunit domain-containing protein [Microbacterium sp. MPKO10]|uniref:terminase large subunit domain-containing protein n=1 Tax=Microbacterium sp. MPKO10 TaxID=2989818 RepID=UPI002235DBA5|nr:terminase family protein [Microbacterium sp. MPKO10]MCW4458177.1 terminase family protein [Microbacterium sp. MPKO10]